LAGSIRRVFAYHRGVNFRYILSAGCLLVALSAGAAALQQEPQEPDVKLPSGKSQREEILKEQHKQNLRDIEEVLDLAAQVKAELEKNNYHVLSIESLKKVKRIEKTAHKVHERMRR
jgi:hypothetical protein